MHQKTNICHRYDDIIELPHHVSVSRKHMSMTERAAQFSPFAALTGYEAAIAETGRLTDSRIELDENRKAVLDCRLQLLLRHLSEAPEVSVLYFLPDERKNGGTYQKTEGRLQKLDPRRRFLRLSDTDIPIDQIYELESPLFSSFFAE